MEIQQLLGFLSVARNKSFSLAAQATFRTQPAISLQIRALEDELGVKLFERIGKRNIRLTQAGESLLELATPVVKAFQDLSSQFEQAQGNYVSIRIATHGSVMEYLLLSALKAFLKTCPKAKISILNRSRSEIVKLVEMGDVDFGITSLSNTPAQLEYKCFVTFPRMLICEKNHPLSLKRKLAIEDIAKFPLILPPPGVNTRAVIENALAAKNLEPIIALELAGHAAVKTYVKMGLGIAILNQYYLRKEDYRDLVVKDVSKDFGYAERALLTRKKSHLSEAAIELMRLISTASYWCK